MAIVKMRRYLVNFIGLWPFLHGRYIKKPCRNGRTFLHGYVIKLEETFSTRIFHNISV